MAIAGVRDGFHRGYNYIHGEIFEVYERFEAAWKKPAAPATWARTSSAAASTSSCTRTTASAPTSAAKKPRCSNRWKARRASRASSRRSRPASACTASRPRSTTPRPSGGALDHPQRRPGLPRGRQAEQRRHQDFSVSGRRQRRAISRSAGHALRQLLEWPAACAAAAS